MKSRERRERRAPRRARVLSRLTAAASPYRRVINKAGPHNVVFDEEAVPAGVKVEDISMDGQIGEEGDTYVQKFDVAGKYAYFCEPHRSAGMNGELIVA